MVTHVDVDVQQLWRDYRAHPTIELRNQLVELYLPLVKYNAERIWQRLPAANPRTYFGEGKSHELKDWLEAEQELMMTMSGGSSPSGAAKSLLRGA